MQVWLPVATAHVAFWRRCRGGEIFTLSSKATGVYEGETEPAGVVVAALDIIDQGQKVRYQLPGLLGDQLRKLADEYDQECIAVTIGDVAFI